MTATLMDAIVGVLTVAVVGLVSMTVSLYRDVAVLKDQVSRHDGLESRLRAIELDLAKVREILEREHDERSRGRGE